MTPQEYQAVKQMCDNIIQQVEQLKSFTFEAACKSNPPEYMRPATPEDIRVGQVIWSTNQDGPYWNIVEQVLHPASLFKGYVAEDGCRYGLDNAFVEIEAAVTQTEATV